MRALLCIAVCLLAGCAQPIDETTRPTDGGSFAPQHDHDSDATESMSLTVDMEPCNEGYCVAAVATNEGREPVYVSNMCVSAWRESMEKDGKDVAHREPRFTCQAFSLAPMEGGAQAFFNTSWDGTVWDDGSSTYVDAKPGAYQWTIHFRAYGSEDGGEPMDLQGTVTVVLGAT